jgi:hypothetical protein
MDRLIPVDSPPAFASDGVLEPLFFGLAPGFVGLQQLDARILRHVQRLPGEAPPQLFHYTVPSSGCELPPTAP